MVIFGFLLLALGLYIVYYYLNYFRRISLTSRGATIASLFQKSTFRWEEVRDIHSITRVQERFLFVSQEFDGFVIELQDKSTHTFCTRYYRNAHELRASLAGIKDQLGSHQSFYLPGPTLPTSTSELSASNQSSVRFSRPLLLSLNGIILVLLLPLTAIPLFFIRMPLIPRLALLVILLGNWFFFQSQLYYFLLGDTDLFVRNQVSPTRKAFRLEDIREVWLEHPSNRSQTLRIITKDYRSRAYAAGSLSTKQWTALEQALQKKGVRFYKA